MKTTGTKKWLAALVAATTLGTAGVAQAADPIRIGAINILSGSASTYGEFAQKGFDLAVAEINGRRRHSGAAGGNGL